MSQNDRLLEYLYCHDGISTLEAMEHLRICRLSERIRELERKGYLIDHAPDESSNARFTRYRLIQVAYG